jgi:BrnA antitoxin of type II toxin-antitoxin system
MKRAITSRKLSPEQIKSVIANAPECVNDPDCPYDPNDARAVAAFWKGGVVVRGGGVAAVRAALAEKRKPGQRGPGKRPPKVAINIRLSPEVLEAFKATGAGWQSKVDGALKEWLDEHARA